MNGRLSLKHGPTLEGRSFGYQGAIAGEVVFATGMTGYPEAFTDPSFAGQILVMTYPLIGNYGVPDRRYWESDRLHIAGLIVSTYNETPSHYASRQTLSEWLVRGKVPALEVKDTRLLTKLIREQGTMLGKIEHAQNGTAFEDPNLTNLVARVSQKNVTYEGRGTKTIVQIDCGTKRNITQCFIKRGVRVITVPWNMNPLSLHERFDGVLISNGPGDPMMATETVKIVTTLFQKRIP